VEGATFVVPADRDLVRRSDAIVIGAAVDSYARWTSDNTIETVTLFQVEESLKGVAQGLIEIVEPGGEIGEQAVVVAGSPRFSSNVRTMVMLRKTGPNRWSATELVLGKFTFVFEGSRRLLVRDAHEINGWQPDGSAHSERARAAESFLRFVREESRGLASTTNYFVDQPDDGRLRPEATMAISGEALDPVALAAGLYSATSYTSSVSGATGARWNVFPSAVSIYRGANDEPGAPGGGTTAVTTAIASWNNDAGSNVNYVYAGVDSTHTSGLTAADGFNTVLFERDLSRWGVGPFTCSGSTYGGTLGLGGMSSAAGTHVYNGETFYTAREVDVEMNRGIANCTLLFSSGEFNSAVTHEIGHTLGFRHSDQNRASSGACSTDPSLECSSSAIMRSSVPSGLNAALQPWDINAVRAVYGAGVSSCIPSFADVPCSHPFYADIETIRRNGVTAGCAPGLYCPNDGVTRAQMAIFLLRGKYGASYNPPAATGRVFTDVPANGSGAAFIEQLYREGITGGCAPGRYCPNAPTTRAQMAIFLLRAKYGASYNPPAARGIFSDVPASDPNAKFIEQLANEGITSGCAPGRFCPNDIVARSQMAVFLVRTFSLS
jgi:hypothetical protein